MSDQNIQLPQKTELPRVEVKIPYSREYVFISIDFQPGGLTDEAIANILMNVSNQMKAELGVKSVSPKS